VLFQQREFGFARLCASTCVSIRTMTVRVDRLRTDVAVSAAPAGAAAIWIMSIRADSDNWMLAPVCLHAFGPHEYRACTSPKTRAAHAGWLTDSFAACLRTQQVALLTERAPAPKQAILKTNGFLTPGDERVGVLQALCDQRRLACSVGVSPTGARVRTP
jgi:hypothetical protein